MKFIRVKSKTRVLNLTGDGHSEVRAEEYTNNRLDKKSWKVVFENFGGSEYDIADRMSKDEAEKVKLEWQKKFNDFLSGDESILEIPTVYK